MLLVGLFWIIFWVIVLVIAFIYKSVCDKKSRLDSDKGNSQNTQNIKNSHELNYLRRNITLPLKYIGKCFTDNRCKKANQCNNNDSFSLHGEAEYTNKPKKCQSLLDTVLNNSYSREYEKTEQDRVSGNRIEANRNG